MSIMTLFSEIDVAVTDLEAKQATLKKAGDTSADVKAKADAVYADAVAAAAKTRDTAVAAAASKAEAAARDYATSLAKAQELKRKFDDQFSGLSTGDGRVRVS
jgi:membrane protein involved in colicin uptake